MIGAACLSPDSLFLHHGTCLLVSLPVAPAQQSPAPTSFWYWAFPLTSPHTDNEHTCQLCPFSLGKAPSSLPGGPGVLTQLEWPMWQGGRGPRARPRLSLDPTLTVDLGKSAHKLSLQILFFKLGVIIPASQGFFFLPGGTKMLHG